MRGIGKGQTIHLFIVPEIKKLIEKTLPRMTGQVEDDVAAWLQLNGMKAEKLQFLQLCSQSMQTVWRKVALDGLLASSGVKGVDVVSDIDGRIGGGRLAPDKAHGLMRFAESAQLRTCIGALRDLVDFDIPREVPTSEPYNATLQRMVDAQRGLVKTAAQRRVVGIVMQQVDDALKTAHAAAQGAKKGLNSEMTREKEREQEQQKQKQQQQQTESMFARDDGEPFKWAVALLGNNPGDEDTSGAGEFPFYCLNAFSPRPKEFRFDKVVYPRVEPIRFPTSVLQSRNFAPLERDGTKPLRLKNVSLILDWYPNGSAGGHHSTVVLTLGEAETVRRLIQAKNAGDHNVCGQLPDGVALALILSPSDTVVDCTRNYPRGAAARSGGASKSEAKDDDSAVSLPMTEDRLCLKFWNNDMFYQEEDIPNLLHAIGQSSTDARRTFFEAAIVARRRSRKSWTGTPLRSIFAFSDDADYNALLETVHTIQEAAKRNNIDLVEACDAEDADGNGFLSQAELTNLLTRLAGSGGSLRTGSSTNDSVSPEQLRKLVAVMDVDGDNAIDYGEFMKMFSSPTPVQELPRGGGDGGGSRGAGGGSDGGGGNRGDDRAKRQAEREAARQRKQEEARRKRAKRLEEQRKRREAEAARRAEQRAQEERERAERERREAAAAEAERRRRAAAQVEEQRRRQRLRVETERDERRQERERERRERQQQTDGGGSGENKGGDADADVERSEREAREQEEREDRERAEREAREDREREAREAAEDREREAREERERHEREERWAQEDRERAERERDRRGESKAGGRESKAGGSESKTDGGRPAEKTSGDEDDKKKKKTKKKKTPNNDGNAGGPNQGPLGLMAQKGADWGSIGRRCDDKDAIMVNGCGCFDQRVLSPADCMANAGCSGESHCCCLGCNYCCKTNAPKYTTRRGQTIALACCVCGQAEATSGAGRCCHTRQQCCCCITNLCCAKPEAAFPGTAYPQLAIMGYSVKPTKGCGKTLVLTDDAPNAIDMEDRGLPTEGVKRGPNALDSSGIVFSIDGNKWRDIRPRFVDNGEGILANGCFCCDQRVFNAATCMANLGCSWEAQACCIGCNFCCKMNADTFDHSQPQAIALPCCVCGQAELETGRCCHVRNQCCCCLSHACCAKPEAAFPGTAYPQLAVLGYSIKPTKGFGKKLPEAEGSDAGSPATATMER